MGKEFYIILVVLFVGILAFLSLYRIGFRLLRKKLSVKVNKYRVVTGFSVLLCLLVTGGAVWLFLAAWFRVGVFESIDRGSLISGLVFPAILLALPALYVAIYRLWRKIGVEDKRFFPKREPTTSTREFETRIPKLTVQPRWRKTGIICAAEPQNNSVWNAVNLVSRLDNIGDCDVMKSPFELRNPKYRIAVVIGTENFFKHSELYGTEEKRDNEFHPELKDFLERGNYLIATHDCHFWDEIGTFGPPSATLRVSATERKHPICKGVGEFSILTEGSRLPNNEKNIKSISINHTPDVKKSLELLEAEVVLPENPPADDRAVKNIKDSLTLSPFPVGWLLKFRSAYFNIFYLYLGHDDHAFYSYGFINLIINAAGYFSIRAKKFF